MRKPDPRKKCALRRFGSPPALRRGGWLPLLLLAVETPTACIVMTQAGSWCQPLKCLERLSNGGRGVTPLSLGEEGFCPQRNGGRRGLACTPPSEATFGREADCPRGCVTGRKWRPEEARRASEMAAGGGSCSRRPCGFALPHGHLLQDPPPASPFHHCSPWPPRGWIPCPSHILSCSRPRFGMWPRKGYPPLDPPCQHCVEGKTPSPPERGALTPALHWTSFKGILKAGPQGPA